MSHAHLDHVRDLRDPAGGDSLRASDVHIESQQSGLRVRYRIDGVLHAQPMPPEIHRFQAAIISRLKIMSRLNIAERRLPQDGRIQLRTGGREVDIRVSVIPMIHGEGHRPAVVGQGGHGVQARQAGHGADLYATFRELIQLPHGIILVTGPTGSGKSTTLYSALLEIKSDETKIITTEDPVEYQLDGINQIQVHPKIGLTFGNSLRSILRHDPDIILVGEIRDLETAENAIQASLTGHLVFSTLHTNDAAGAYTRLVDMGLEPFLVSSTVEAVMAQRLVRTLCTHCKQPYHPSRDELPPDFPREALRRASRCIGPVGCRECRQVGYRGRVGLVRVAGDHRGNPAIVARAGEQLGHPAGGRPTGDADAPRGRLGEGARRPDDDRRSDARDQRARSREDRPPCPNSATSPATRPASDRPARSRRPTAARRLPRWPGGRFSRCEVEDAAPAAEFAAGPPRAGRLAGADLRPTGRSAPQRRAAVAGAEGRSRNRPRTRD